LKILIINSAFYPATIYGGPSYSTYYLSKHLANVDCNVLVATTNANGKERLKIETNKKLSLEKNLKVKYYDETIIGRFSFQYLINVWKDIKESDIVHTQPIFSTVSLISLFYCRIFNKPLILSPRGSLGKWSLLKGSLYKSFWIIFFIKPFASRINFHATSRQEEQDIKKFFPRSNVFMVPNGVNLIEEAIEIKKDNKYLKKIVNREFKYAVICLSRLHKVKGLDILIESFSEIKQQKKEVVLILAGEDDGEKINLMKIIEAKELQNDVFIIPALYDDEKDLFLAEGDIFALPSHHENFGIVYAEALAAGTPIVASIHSPWQEVEKYNCGKWVNNDAESFANAISELLHSNLELLSSNAFNFAKKFSWDIIAAQMKTEYEKILNKNKHE